MKRVNLLATDRSSSVSKMTTTGQANHTGSAQTKATKSLFSHFMFLAGLLLITLLTSGKAMAEDTYTVTLTGSNITVTPNEPIAIGTKTFTLVANEGYKLPATLTSVVYDATGDNTTLTLNSDLSSANQFSYVQATGVVTISEATNIAASKIITITADGVALSTDATLSALTYSHSSIASGAGQAVPNFSDATIPNVELTYNSALIGQELTITATENNEFAKAEITGNTSIQVGENTVVVTVTAENGDTKTYTVKFIMAKDELSAITVPSDLSSGLTLSAKVTTADDVLTILNSDYSEFEATTAGGQTPKLAVSWSLKDQTEFNPAADATNLFTWEIEAATLEAANLTDGEQTLTGDVTITNAAVNTKLATLTYTIGDAVEDVANLDDQSGNKEYKVALDGTIAPDATITITAEAEESDVEVTGTTELKISENTATTTLTIGERTVKITFTRTPSADATLQSLTYKVGENGSVLSVPEFEANKTSYNIALPYTTEATADVYVIPTPNSLYATFAANVNEQSNAPSLASAEPLKITLVSGTGTLSFTVAAENAEATQNVAINFTTAKEKITAIEVPVAPVLTKEDANADAETVKAKVDAIKNVTATLESGATVDLAITWALKNETVFTAVPGAKNTYTWTITSQEKYELGQLETTGDMVVINYVAAFTEGGEEVDLDIKNTALINQIGNGQEEIVLKSATVNTNLDALAFDKATVKEGVTINSSNEVKELIFNETTVAGKIDLQGSVPSLILNKATIGEIALAASKTTVLSLEAGNNIAQITNAGTLTLDNASNLKSFSLAVETKAAALENTGAVKAVANNGTFTDNTASIVTVTGDASLSITSLPQNQSTYGKEATLAVVAESANGETITYQWEKYISDAWTNANGTGKATATLKVGKTDDGAGSFRCKVVSTKNSATTTLYTPAVTVTFRSESTGGNPEPTPSTYIVKLPKVTGATFSKDETTSVSEGDNFSFSITLDKEYDQSTPVVTVDNATYMPDSKGVYTIKGIARNITIVVTGIVKNTATGIEDITENSIRVWSEGSTLYIHTPEAADAYIVDATGRLMDKVRVSGDYSTQMRAGFYIVRINNFTKKVIIR